MEDRSYKYTEDYIRVRLESLKREYDEQVNRLQKHHLDSMNKWKKDPSLLGALEAAYREEMNQTREFFKEKTREMQEEIRALVQVGSQKIKDHLLELESKAKDLFSLINNTLT